MDFVVINVKETIRNLIDIILNIVWNVKQRFIDCIWEECHDNCFMTVAF